MRGLVDPGRELWKNHARGDAPTDRDTPPHATDRTLALGNRNGSANQYARSYTDALQGDIYVVNADGSGLQRPIEDGFWADWSPDGAPGGGQIVFASNRDGNVELYVADADGSNQRRLTENTRLEFFPAWSPDGQRIAFATMEQKQIRDLHLERRGSPARR